MPFHHHSLGDRFCVSGLWKNTEKLKDHTGSAFWQLKKKMLTEDA